MKNMYTLVLSFIMINIPSHFFNHNNSTVYTKEKSRSTLYAPIQPIVQNSITLNGAGIFDLSTSIKVCIDISHPYLEDLEVKLTAPNGITILLSKNNGSSFQNYKNTCFSRDAELSIKSGEPPFFGYFLPEGDFRALNGTRIAGTWEIEVNDFIEKDDGVFNFWSIEIDQRATTRAWAFEKLEKNNMNFVGGK